MSGFIDLTDKTFNHWTVLDRAKSKQTPDGQFKTYWNCLCSCGKLKAVYMDSLISGKSKSCGHIRGKEEGEASKRSAYNLYIAGARKRNRNFEITFEEFKELSKLNCYYCGSKPTNIAGGKNNKGKYKYNGLDRIDNTKDYYINNVVPCCKHCNLAKRQLTQIDFLNLIKKIYEKHCK